MGFIYAMGKIPNAEFIPYVVDCFRKTGKECPDTIVEDMYEYVSGNTYYMQKLSHILWNMIIPGEKATKEMFDTAKNELLKSESSIFQGTFVEMNFGEKKLIRALSAEPTGKPYAIEYLSRHGLNAGGVQKSLKSLVDKDVIEKEDGIYRLVDAVFGKWCSKR